jgi:hypothetical protein
MVLLLIFVVMPVLVLGVPVKKQILDMTHALIDNGKMPIYPGITKYNFTINMRGKAKRHGNV